MKIVSSKNIKKTLAIKRVCIYTKTFNCFFSNIRHTYLERDRETKAISKQSNEHITAYKNNVQENPVNRFAEVVAMRASTTSRV